MRLKLRMLAAAGAVVLVLGGVAVVAFATATPGSGTNRAHGTAASSQRATPSHSATPSPKTMLTPAQIAALPEAKYSAVIPGLIAYTASSAPVKTTTAYTLHSDTAIYGKDRATPVARFSANNFLGQKSVIVPVTFNGEWVLVLTPARQVLPSAAAGNAPAQTAGWVRMDALTKDHPLKQRIVVALEAQTLTIEDTTRTTGTAGTKSASFKVGVGTSATPTPTGVTGYLQARYLDPAQGQSIHPINLSSLHSAGADEPYSGNDGGLIGMHYFQTNRGAISHGCIRLSKDAITAVNQLPLGTLISITS